MSIQALPGDSTPDQTVGVGDVTPRATVQWSVSEGQDMQNNDSNVSRDDTGGEEGTVASRPAQRQTSVATSGVASRNGDAGNLDESSPSMADLVSAYQTAGRPNFVNIRKGFERKHGDILEEYYARHHNLGAALVRARRSKGSFDEVRYIISLAYDARISSSRVDALVRAARIEERRWSTVLTRRNQLIIEKAIFSLLVSLLNLADTAKISVPEGEREKKDAESAKEELASIVILAKALGRKSTLLAYLAGMVIGALAVVFLVLLINTIPPQFSSFHANLAMTYSVVCGAVGAVISVMVRVNRGQIVNIDPDQGQFVGILSGAFRPVIGAIFGTAVWVFITGELIPLSVPSEADRVTFFFCSLAFLAGFSERWAQDAIVQSAPKLPFAFQGSDDKEKSK